MANNTNVTIEKLIVYPVKSLRGIEVAQWPITPQGLQYDRHWMLVMPNGRFVSQRQLPKMALINTAIANESLTLSAEGYGEVSLPLVGSNQSERFQATVWRDECDVIEASVEVSAWLNNVLQPAKPLRLVSIADNFIRPQSNPERFGEETFTAFADAAPFLVANTASLDQLNRQLQQQQSPLVDMRRFRPNIVISGLAAFEEHRVQRLSHNDGLALNLRDHCERCIMTTINPDNAEKDPSMQPFKTLLDLNPMPDNHKAPAFAVNATLEPARNSLWQVGDELAVQC
ncbi:MAG: MOSC domain-containing protein [Cellvibrionaceae bacterium]